MTAEELAPILAHHAKWLNDEPDGKRAILTGADLTDANLTGAVLTGADLTRAVLTGADLTRAVLTGAVLTGANLTGAVLTGADLTDADLTGAVLTDAKGILAPVVPHIDAAILAEIERDSSTFNMNDWHSCETTHCRAGWAVVLAGPAGRMLEQRIGSGPAGALIYAASRPGKPVPNFYANTADAIADIRKCAAEDPLPEPTHAR